MVKNYFIISYYKIFILGIVNLTSCYKMSNIFNLLTELYMVASEWIDSNSIALIDDLFSISF